MSLEPDHREQTIRDRSEWAMEWLGGHVLFSGAEVGHLLRVIDELREPVPALVAEQDDGHRRIGPDFDTWGQKGMFAGRILLLPNGDRLKLHTIVLRDLFWYVPLPTDPAELKRCLLTLVEFEGIDLRPEP